MERVVVRLNHGTQLRFFKQWQKVITDLRDLELESKMRWLAQRQLLVNMVYLAQKTRFSQLYRAVMRWREMAFWNGEETMRRMLRMDLFHRKQLEKILTSPEIVKSRRALEHRSTNSPEKKDSSTA